MYTHLSEKLTLSQLSRQFFLSESAISAYITQTTGLSFFDLLGEMRIGRSISFLLYTDLTMEQLAEILGFVDSSHISKVFSARLGTRRKRQMSFGQGLMEIVDKFKVKVNEDERIR